MDQTHTFSDSQNYALLLRSNKESSYADKEGEVYNYSSNVPNNKKIISGVKVLFDRKTPEGVIIYGQAVVGEVREEAPPSEIPPEKRASHYYIAELKDFTPFELQRGLTQQERMMLEHSDIFKYNVQHAIRPISLELFNSLTSSSLRLVKTVEELIDTIRTFGSESLEKQSTIPLGQYFVYDTVSGWIAPCKFAGIHGMTVDLYSQLLDKGGKASVFDGHRTQKKIQSLCGSPVSGGPAVDALKDYFTQREIAFSQKPVVLYSVGPNPEKPPQIKRLTGEILSIGQQDENGEKRLQKLLMLLTAILSTYEDKTLTYEFLSKRYNEIARCCISKELKSSYPYGSLRARNDSNDEAFWLIKNETDAIVTGDISSPEALLRTHIEWTGRRDECLRDRRLVAIIIDTLLSLFDDAQKELLIPYIPFLRSSETVSPSLVTPELEKIILSPYQLVHRVWKYCAEAGFSFSEEEIAHTYLALKTKPFLLLAGPSGSGKTRLASFFARALGYSEYIIPVQPDWTDRSDLIGYRDLSGSFRKQRMLNILIDACRDSNRSTPYIVILDEMNLARVEHYFNDFLSLMETRERYQEGEIRSRHFFSPQELSSLMNGEELEGVCIPENFFLIGTVNMDETTHPFSKKVLDRANTIEMPIGSLGYTIVSETSDPTQEIQVPVHVNSLRSTFARLEPELYHSHIQFFQNIISLLDTINTVLKPAGCEVGYRVRDEICLYCHYARDLFEITSSVDGKALVTLDSVLDRQWLQKIVPRIQGSFSSLKKCLGELFSFFMGFAVDPYKGDESHYAEMILKNTDKAPRYPRSAEKLARMITRGRTEHYTSFWI